MQWATFQGRGAEQRVSAGCAAAPSRNLVVCHILRFKFLKKKLLRPDPGPQLVSFDDLGRTTPAVGGGEGGDRPVKL